MIFGIKKIYNFDPYNVFLAIATNIPQRLKTGWSRVTYYIFLLQLQEDHETHQQTL